MTKENVISTIKNSKTAGDAAKHLGISRASLFSYLKKNGLRYDDVIRGNGNSDRAEGAPDISPEGQDLFHEPDLCAYLLKFLTSLNPYRMQGESYEGYKVRSRNQTIRFYVQRDRANERQAR